VDLVGSENQGVVNRNSQCSNASNLWTRIDHETYIMNNMKEQLLELLYRKRYQLFPCAASDEFESIVAKIKDGTITTFEELAKYGVTQ
jgi:hypothetical protein